MIQSKPFISIIIPLFNEEKYIRDCLDSLFSLNYPTDKLEIIVVDNGSSDRSAEIVKEYAVKLYSLPEVKVGAVRNYGVSKSNIGEYVAFLDADCTVEPEWLEAGVIELQTYDAVGGLVKLRKDPSWIEKYWLLNDSVPSVFQNTFSGASIFIKRNVFEDIGGFDENLNAGEDSALTSSLINQGYKINITTRLNVTHLGFPTTVADFIDRQKWHASDYIEKLGDLFRDKVLFIVVLYLTSIVFMPVGFLFSDVIFLISLATIIVSPAIFSTKRIIRYGGLKPGYSVLLIYCVDFLYLIGRVYGLLTGIFFKIYKSKKGDVKISKNLANQQENR